MLATFSRLGFDLAFCSYCLFLLAQSQAETMTLTPTNVFVYSTLIAVVAGLASLIRSDKRNITTRDVVSHTLNMGTCGASLSMLMYVYVTPRHGTDFFIIALVGILSLMGLPLISFVTTLGQSIVRTVLEGNRNNDVQR